MRMLVDIAIYQDSGKVKIKDVSSRQDMSVKYLEQIVTVLSKNGVVKGERGPQGGYKLTRPASEISVAEIVRLIEGDITPNPQSKDEKGERDEWASLEMWKRIDDAVMGIMGETTIQNILDDAASKGLVKVGSLMPEYYI